jgi:peptide/nickel transport system permease protein
LVQSVLALLIISALAFALLAAVGGDALTALRNDPRISEQTIEELRRVYGLDQPITARYARWLMDAARGRLSYSFYYQAPVGSIIWPRLLNTAALAAAALLIAWPVAFALGVLAARRPGSRVDYFCSGIILVTSSTPRLVLALVTLSLIARTTLFKTGGAVSDLSAGGWLLRLLPPALVLSVPLVALYLAQTRTAIGAALNQEFVRVACAKGLPERVVLVRHALRAALNPLITIFGYSLGGMMSGSVVVERVFDWPGLGHLSVVALRSRDASLLMGVVLVVGALVLAANLLADLLLLLNDPRLRARQPPSSTAR